MRGGAGSRRYQAWVTERGARSSLTPGYFLAAPFEALEGRAGSRVLLALAFVNNYPGILMLNRALVIFILFGVAAAVKVPAQAVESERRVFSQVKAKAERGDAEAQLQLGFFYANGTGVAPDAVKACKWHRKAAEQGFARAQYQLGLDYANGEGVKADKAEAVHWFHAAAEEGFAQAQLELGLCYLEGRGVGENGAEALKWFRSAASQGLAYAGYAIGNCYLQGIGVAKDIEEGIKWIKQAAVEGVATSQNALGVAYEKGDGVPKDAVQAYKWFALAAAQDDEHSSDIRLSLAKLEANLTKDQIAEAQRLAREFRPERMSAPASANSLKAAGQSVLPTQSQPSAANQSAKTGSVTVKADDDVCEVFVDGGFVGNSPAKLRLAEGTHLFQIKKSGFKDYQRALKVTAGCELNLHAILEKQ